MNACKKHLIGRTIVAVDWHQFRTDRHGNAVSTQPVLTLDNGRKIYFSVDETEIGEYGVRICLIPAPVRQRKTKAANQTTKAPAKQ